MVDATDAAEAVGADMAVVASDAVVIAAREKSGLKKICTRRAMPVQRAAAVTGTQAVIKPKEKDRRIEDQP